MGKFKKGVFFGGLLGAGLMWLGTTKKGREIREKILDQATEVYDETKEKIVETGLLEKIDKNEYVELVKEKVNKYAIENGLADDVKKMIEKVVVGQWNNFKKSIKKKK